ncbi:Dioxygenase swnH1 [Fusarium oxysporum f. sp. albedinis]|nr:Dioxygenase swnH1 [Fusarium oxysporum f. sp. albedinis]
MVDEHKLVISRQNDGDLITWLLNSVTACSVPTSMLTDFWEYLALAIARFMLMPNKNNEIKLLFKLRLLAQASPPPLEWEATQMSACHVTVNSDFFTNNTALTYTLSSVWERGNDGQRVISPALTYHGNILQDCSVHSVEIDFASLARAGKQIGFCEWGAVLRSYISCKIDTPDGEVFFNMTQTYDYVPDTTSSDSLGKFLGTGFLGRNKTTQASLWWGESLMSTFWGEVTLMLQDQRGAYKDDDDKIELNKGTVSFMINDTNPNIEDLRFFSLDYRFYGSRINEVACCPGLPLPLTAKVLDESDTYPNIWIKADSLAKAAYSTILVDLGQEAAPKSNILTDTKLLTRYTANFSTARMANLRSGPANDSYSALKKTTGHLGITPSVIATTYICQVPRLKPAGNLIVAIIVADLVLLQAVWQLYKLSAEFYLSKKHRDSAPCERCSGVGQVDDPVLPSMPSQDSGLEYSPLVNTPAQSDGLLTGSRA